MKDLIRKYRTDSLSQPELEESRKKAASLSDQDIGNAIYADWSNADVSEGDTACVSLGQQTSIKQNIDAKLNLKRHSMAAIIWNAVRTAAMIMLPVCMAAIFILYNAKPQITQKPMTVATLQHQQATVTLPDSSKVILNSESTLTCDRTESETGTTRCVAFTGEAFFDIHKDSKHPFIINARGFKVTVLGTKFNLNAPDDGTQAVLYLKEGLVRMTAIDTGQEIEVHPDEKAVFNYADGTMSLESLHVNDNILAWLSGNLEFNNEKLSRVFQLMEKHYGCTLSASDESMLDESFTGTIPADDLPMAIAVIERTFGIRITLAPSTAR